METIPDAPDEERTECPAGCPHLERVNLLSWRCNRKQHDNLSRWMPWTPWLDAPSLRPMRHAHCLRAGLPEGCEEASEDG